MPEHQASKGPSGALPALGHHTERDILRDDDPGLSGCQGQKFKVRQFVRVLFGSSKNINTAPTELPDYRAGTWTSS